MPEDQLRLPLSNRAFQYNDGFFETMMIREGSISFWEGHCQRMQEAAKSLQLQLPPLFYATAFLESLLALAARQQALSLGRLKLKVWRAGAGLYTPETNEVAWLATARPASPTQEMRLQVGVCQSTRTAYSPLSHFKGPNAPLYVQAGLEKKEQAKDDMLLLDTNGHVAEFISSNLFWVKAGVIHTPPLTTGCVNGVLRRTIFSWCEQQQVQLTETLAELRELCQADLVFAANVTGIRAVSQLAQIELPTQHPLLGLMQKSLFNL